MELTSQRATETREEVVRLGRETGSAIAFAEADARVVSARHAELRHTRDGWCLADLGSRNGTFLNGRRIAAEVPVTTGDVISLGETGPRLRVAALAEPLPETVPEHPAVEGRAYAVSLLDAGTGRRFEARGTRIRLGRGRPGGAGGGGFRGGGGGRRCLGGVAGRPPPCPRPSGPRCAGSASRRCAR